MKKTFLIIAILAFSTVSFAQMQTLLLNAKYLQFDNGRELPAEQAFIINSEVPGTVEMVKMQLSNVPFKLNKQLYESIWVRKENDNTTVAILPNYFKLKSGNKYNFKFLYYRNLQETERQQVSQMLKTTVQAFLTSNIEQKETKYLFRNSPSDIYSSLNTLLSESMVDYETRRGSLAPKWSGIIENMLTTMAKSKISKDTDVKNADNLFAILKNEMNNEITMFANSYDYVLSDVVSIEDYPTEKTMNTISLNIGYAGIYNSGDFSNLDYYSGPYLGISLPLGNRAFNSNFWSKTSLSAGIFLQDFTATNSAKISGPIAEKPIYFGVGYKIFKFLRLQAGTTVLEETDPLNGDKSVYMKPFIGLSMEFQLWLGVNKQ